MEGLNLRKISLKSDTYDFYTRIYPIGKDGITPEWLTGKKITSTIFSIVPKSRRMFGKTKDIPIPQV